MSARILHGSLIASSSAGVWFGTLVPELWFLAIVGFAVFMYGLLFHANSTLSAYTRGAVVGFASGGAGVYWMWNMLPMVDSSGASAPAQWTLVAIVWGVTSLLAALSSGAAGVLIYLVRKSTFIAPMAACIWIIQEEARMWLYALYSYSTESLFGPHFSQTAIGYALASQSYLLQLAYPFGLVALTFSLVIFATTLAYVMRRILGHSFSLASRIAVLITAVLALYPLVFHAEVATGRPLRAAVFSTTNGTSPQALFEKTVIENPNLDLVIFPEGIDPTFATDQSYLDRIFKDRNTLIVSSRHAATGSHAYTGDIVYRSVRGGELATYQKLFLMPQGEYLPAIAEFLYPLSGNAAALQYAQTLGDRLVRGPGLVVQEHDGYIVGGLLCSDLLSPHLYRSLVERHGADILLNLANPSWFHGSRTYHDKTVQIARVHAVENARPLIVASNDAPSYIVTSKGNVTAMTAWGMPSVLVETVLLPN